jgi:uncharacterized zinc-type alcohol dehydrogenase-like protein
MDIKAWGVDKPNEKIHELHYQKELGENEVLIHLKYCSLLRADVFFIENFWGDSKYPMVPSSEMFGVVSQVGKNVRDVETGDYVGANYQVYSCGECSYCKAGKEQFCGKQRVIEANEFGGLAENIIVDSRFVYKIPEKLQKPEYVGLMGYGLTAYSAIKNSNIKKGSKVGVLGVGNLGQFAVQILNKMGFEVTALTHSDNKHENLRKIGAKDFLNPLDVKELENNKKTFDFIHVTSYHSYDWPKIIELLKPEGNLCFNGLPDENISFPAVLLADYAQRKVTGSYLGSRNEMKELLEFAEKNDIKSETTVYPLEKAQEVLDQIKENKIPFYAAIKIEK